MGPWGGLACACGLPGDPGGGGGEAGSPHLLVGALQQLLGALLAGARLPQLLLQLLALRRPPARAGGGRRAGLGDVTGGGGCAVRSSAGVGVGSGAGVDGGGRAPQGTHLACCARSSCNSFCTAEVSGNLPCSLAAPAACRLLSLEESTLTGGVADISAASCALFDVRSGLLKAMQFGDGVRWGRWGQVWSVPRRLLGTGVSSRWAVTSIAAGPARC
jgi:hypothetical protein